MGAMKDVETPVAARQLKPGQRSDPAEEGDQFPRKNIPCDGVRLAGQHTVL
jgi:hypothetical protein